ncbi:MAG: COR domain-containing protein [Saprospiraceae bacterium]
MAQIEQILQQHFGNITFEKQANIDAIRRFYSNYSYCLDEEGKEIVGLACCASDCKDLSFTAEFKHLQYLNISRNSGLKTLHFAAAMPDLIHLDLNSNVLEQLIIPTGFDALKHLDVSRNKLKQLEMQGSFPALTFLDISANQVGTLTLNTPALQYAYLLDNQLSTLNFISITRQLEVLHLKKNKLESLPGNFSSFDSLKSLFLHGNPLPAIPKELISTEENGNSYEEVWNYLKDLGEGTVINTRVKLIIVGNGRVGKTSMYRRLANKPYNQQEPFTHGVQIGQLDKKDLPEVKTEDLKLQAWDFGGQEIFYATHQFFLSDEAIYVLAWTHKDNVAAYKEREKDILPFDEQWRSCEYWLENIRLRATGSPILMVQTHSDVIQNKCTSDPDWEKPPYDAISINFSAAKDFGLMELKNLLSNQLNVAIPMLGQAFPRSYEEVIQLIGQLKQEQPSITHDHFLQLCNQAGIQKGGEQTLLEYLVKSGVVVYFDKPLLKEVIYIDPNWLTKQVYLLINNELKPLKGRIDQAYLDRLLPSPTYDDKKRSQFVELLKSFELIFEPRGESFYIAPQYLPEKLDSTEQKLHNIIFGDLALAFVFRFPKFLPDNVMINFLSRYGPFSNDIYWKNGICFSSEQGANCIVHFEEANRSLKVYSKKDQVSQMLQKEICDAFVELSRNANAEISLNGDTFASWQELEKYAKLSPANPMQQFFATDGTTPLLLKDFALFWNKEFRPPMEDIDQQDQKEGDRFHHIKELIGDSHLKEALEALLQEDIGTYKTEIVQLQQSLSALQRKVNAMVINHSEESIQRNNISLALLDLISAIEDNKTPQKPESSPSSTSKPASKIYFSYAWGDKEETGGSRVEMVNKLYDSLIADGFEVLRDNMNIEYGGLISEFMKALGKGDLIVVFVSEKYAKSPYCMFELYEIARNSKWDRTLFSSRILIIPVEPIRFDDPEVLEEYFDYWERQYNKWKKLMEKRLEQSTGSTYTRYENTKAITQKFGDLSDWLIDINASSLSLLSENDFHIVKETIQKRLKTES